jgi:hypothetical protein
LGRFTGWPDLVTLACGSTSGDQGRSTH